MTIPALAPAACAVAERQALIVGVGGHQDDSMDLPGIGLDAAMMRAAAERLGLPVRSVRTLLDEDAPADGGYEAREMTVRHGDSPTTQRVALRAVGPKAGDQFRDCPECPEMVVVPAGSYQMGSPSHERGRDDDEGPLHGVTIAAPLAVGKYEVTFAEWDACGEAGGCGGHVLGDRGWGRGQRPVIHVSWRHAQRYVRWLFKKTGKPYRLLSESEWEYAARAGTQTAYSWGDQIGSGRANCDGCGSQWDGRSTAPAGSFEANRWGLHDMHGNVWEWTEDCWNDRYGGAPVDGSAWEYGDCAKRVLRGGSWINRPPYLRAAGRIWMSPGVRHKFNGFRVARTLAP